MEYIKFEADELNEYFAKETGKTEFTIQDIQETKNNSFVIKRITITQGDLDILSQISDKSIRFVEVNFSGLKFGKCNYSDLTFKNCNLNNTKMDEIQSPRILISMYDCNNMTTEQLKNWKDTCSTKFQFEIKDDAEGIYDIEQFTEIITVMEEIKDAIPENSTDLEKFLFIYNILGKNIVYDNSGVPGNKLCTNDGLKSTKSLKGALISGQAVCLRLCISIIKCCKLYWFRIRGR